VLTVRTTTPQGATVFVEGRGEVCAASPCQFEVPASSEPITLRANSGRYQAELSLIPSDDQTLPLTLRPARGGRRRGRAGRGASQTEASDPAPSSGRRRRGGPNDLKIPRMFED